MYGLRVENLTNVEEFEKTPLEERLTAFNTYEMISQGVAINPDANAISFFLSGGQYREPTRITYREFLQQINRTANLFHDLGIGPSSVVSYLLPNLPQTHYALWGGEATGIVNPINPLLEPATIRDICLSAKTEVLVALGEFPGSDIWEKALKVRKDLPNLKAVIRVMGPSDEKEGIYGYEELLPRYKSDELDSGREIAPEDVASLFHTGGTTGTPKLAPHTHFNEAFMAFATAAVSDVGEGEVMMCGLPLFHVNATTITGSFPFSIGAQVVLLSPRGYRDPDVIKNFYNIVDYYRAVTFSSVPTVLAMLLDVPKDDADISSLRYAICGAAPLSGELFRRFEEHTGLKIGEGYGLTEGTCVSSLNPLFGERKIGSIGVRLPYQDMEVLAVDSEGRFTRAADCDEIGAVCIKGPNVFKGYLDDAHNKGIWAKDGWFNTGDLGRKDKDGYFWITGRKKELIIRGGHNIDPATIEEPLYSIPGVQVAAAVGRPDPHAGEVPIAYVQLQNGVHLESIQILERLKAEIGERAAIPKEVVILDEIPLTPVGKIFKPALRWAAIRSVYGAELQSLGQMADAVDVNVKEDKIHGCVATITVKPAPDVSEHKIRDKISEILARYTVRYSVDFV